MLDFEEYTFLYRESWRDPLLRDVSLFGTVLVAVYLPIEAVLLPAWFERQGRPEQLGGVLMAFAVGGIAGVTTPAGTVTADHYVAALPVEIMRNLAGPPLRRLDPALVGLDHLAP